MARAAQLQSHIRVVKQQPTPVLASLLDAEFSPQVCVCGVCVCWAGAWVGGWRWGGTEVGTQGGGGKQRGA